MFFQSQGFRGYVTGAIGVGARAVTIQSPFVLEALHLSHQLNPMLAVAVYFTLPPQALWTPMIRVPDPTKVLAEFQFLRIAIAIAFVQDFVDASQTFFTDIFYHVMVGSVFIMRNNEVNLDYTVTVVSCDNLFASVTGQFNSCDSHW